MPRYILAFDTSNETVAVGLGLLPDAATPEPAVGLDLLTAKVHLVASVQVEAHRASNTMLIPQIQACLNAHGVDRGQIAAVVCGRGPGSFTGVRICMATAKGLASALRVPLFGVSTLDAVAWNAWRQGIRGRLAVVADAMRKEVYPALFFLSDQGVERLTLDTVVKAASASDWLSGAGLQPQDHIAGDGLVKYSHLFETVATCTDPQLWNPTGAGLLLAPRMGGDAATLLPVYTRLSDAEEAERVRLSKTDAKDLATGVQHASMATDEVTYRPLDAAHVQQIAQLDAVLMPKDSWSAGMFADELSLTSRTWWAAYHGPRMVGYCGGWLSDGAVQILKVAVDPEYRRRGVALRLVSLVAEDARNLAATEMTLEVRASNVGAQAFYERIGLRSLGVRPRYYPDREDAVIMTGPLPGFREDVAGMRLHKGDVVEAPCVAAASDPSVAVAPDPSVAAASDPSVVPVVHAAPLILAIESSCDETAAAIIDGAGALRSDVVASQIDFHARFGGVVPEIASRKHIEAICGVCDACLEQAAASLGRQSLTWSDLDAVAVTYAPGLVGALVVGLAFAKGVAFGADIPLVVVNHLEGHLYANRLATRDLQPPMVVSLVSGGHTMLVHVKDWGDYETMGSTIDDAVGEAFDKVSKALGLGYPGGPIISKLAAQGNPKAINFPRALLHSHDLRFSLSGLKTAVLTYIQKERQQGRELNMPDIAASFQAAVIDVQVAKAKTALEQTGAKEFCLGGGVAANPQLRAAYQRMCDKAGVRLTLPPLSACGDNAAMIAEVALVRYNQGKLAGWDVDVAAHAPLDEAY